MLFLLSPAKSLDYDSAAPVSDAGLPHFSTHAEELIGLLRRHDQRGVAELMDLSAALAALNVARYAAWSPRSTAANSKPALFAFNGDVYEGLAASRLSAGQVTWVQENVAILSGLYGVLRPLDRMQPYRLEMGTRLANPQGKDLYAYWGPRIAAHLNERLADERTPVVVNLASEEYFKAVDRRALKARVVHCVFQDWKGGAYKIISFHAKRARGLMVRYAAQRRARTPRALAGFDLEGYAFDACASEPDRLVFRRRLP
ncbi:peroxide stress protein YaaA [Methylibium sp.]|uniref:peroxide stress protein YaaA n=1 Tax=Methylibium sp. TaxID=2067992 RepID=UPI003D144498